MFVRVLTFCSSERNGEETEDDANADDDDNVVLIPWGVVRVGSNCNMYFSETCVCLSLLRQC